MNKPVFALAPMADVTDAAFRRIIAKYGKPSICYTEFVSADGLALAPDEGRKKLLADLMYSESERPIYAQFFTGSPEHMRRAAFLARDLGFDGVDINMGCPDQAVVRQGAGACLIRHPEAARQLIRAAKEAGLPVSVKTRLGFGRDELEDWLPELLAEEPESVAIHLRTKKEMSKVPAHWERMRRAVEIRDALKSRALLLGNGDVKNLSEAEQKIAETGADGVMLGRAIFGNPWLFARREPPLAEKLRVMVEHTRLFEALLGGIKSFNIMKKHYKAYAAGFDGAAELRAELMDAPDASTVERIVERFLASNEP